MSTEVALSVRGLTKRFGGLIAVSELDFDVQRASITAIIGPNGAGKTTTFNMLAGAEKLSGGTIFLDGKDISGREAYQVCEEGVGRTFQLTQIFGQMTVLENIMVGFHSVSRGGFLASGFRLPFVRREEKRLRERGLELAEWVGLLGYADVLAGDLPFGQQRLIELARAMATNPKLLLLDEPASGLDNQESDQLAEMLREIRGQGVTVLLIEHDMRFVMSLAERIVVMDYGSKIAVGSPEEIRNSPVVLEAYLGGAA